MGGRAGVDGPRGDLGAGEGHVTAIGGLAAAAGAAGGPDGAGAAEMRVERELGLDADRRVIPEVWDGEEERNGADGGAGQAAAPPGAPIGRDNSLKGGTGGTVARIGAESPPRAAVAPVRGNREPGGGSDRSAGTVPKTWGAQTGGWPSWVSRLSSLEVLRGGGGEEFPTNARIAGAAVVDDDVAARWGEGPSLRGTAPGVLPGMGAQSDWRARPGEVRGDGRPSGGGLPSGRRAHPGGARGDGGLSGGGIPGRRAVQLGPYVEALRAGEDARRGLLDGLDTEGGWGRVVLGGKMCVCVSRAVPVRGTPTGGPL